MMFIWIVLLILVIWIVWQYSIKGNLRDEKKEEDAFDILKRRFANGEIDVQEYEERKAKLEKEY